MYSYNWTSPADLNGRTKPWLTEAGRERDLQVSNLSRASLVMSLLRWEERQA